MKHILDLSPDSLKQWMAEHKQSKFRANQILSWICGKRATSFDDMTDIAKNFRAELSREFQILTTSVERHQQAGDGTEKLLLRLSDGEKVECVLLRDGIRRTVCISSQVGCAMGCVFCATGQDGLVRNLTTGELVEQMLQLQLLLNSEERLSHIVVMGMGEPFANFDNLAAALNLIGDDYGLGIGARKITISTVGIPDAIDKLSELNCRYNLAVSLHAPNDELRNKIVPSNRKLGIANLLDASDKYFDVTGRKLTYEYILLAGINDQLEHARQLAKLLKNRKALLNLIPYNKVDNLPYDEPGVAAVHRFYQTVESNGIFVIQRKRKGDEINASCGQLRRSLLSDLNDDILSK